MVSDHSPAVRRRPGSHDHTGGRRGHPRASPAGLDDHAIANHVGRDRKTVRNYLNGKREPGVRKRTTDPFGPFVEYVTARLVEDPHLWAVSLFDELEPLGFTASYQTLTRQIRARQLRPVCTDCGRATERANAVIPHPAGEETQWDWLDLPDPPTSWGWGSMAHLLVGSLAHSGRWRGYLAATMDQPHLVEGLDRISRSLGGVTQRWRFDRMATVCHPGSGRVTATFSGVAKHYGVMIKICPPKAGHRKGVVEKVNHTAAQRWWRTLADELTVEQAQADCDRFATVRGDTRLRRSHSGDRKATVATVAAREPLRPVPPVPYPLQLTQTRVASRQALVSYRGNQYSVPPELASATITVTQQLGTHMLDISTSTYWAWRVTNGCGSEGNWLATRRRQKSDINSKPVRLAPHRSCARVSSCRAAAGEASATSAVSQAFGCG